MYRGPDGDDPRWKIFRDFREPGQVVRVAIDAEHRVFVHFNGRGSTEGARAVTAMMDVVRDELGHDTVFEAIVDMRDLDGAPLRAQFIIGRWLLGRKKQISKVAIFGGKPFEMKVARAVMTVARMHNAHFCDHLDEAMRWLGWPREVYPDGAAPPKPPQ